MSDYVFHPRFNESFMQTYNEIYYRAGSNAFKPSGLRFTYNEWYAFGRFWEIIDSQIQNAAQTIPANLGYVKQIDVSPQQTIIDYRENEYWFDAALFDVAGYWAFENTDNYNRFTGSAMVGCLAWFIWGTPSTSYNSVVGIVERVDTPTSFVISMYDQDVNEFRLYNVLYNHFTNGQGFDVTLKGFIENPIYQMYDNIRIGKPIGKKFQPWMVKKIIERNKGVII